MNDIIKKIEAEQLKAEVPEFNVGDTVKVYGKSKKETVKEFRFSKVQCLRNKVEAQEQHLQLERILTELVLKRLGHYTHQT